MEISTFELGIEPIILRDLGNSKLNAIFERLTGENRIVVQGYYLKLSNLETFDRVFKLILNLHSPVIQGENRLVASYDLGGDYRHLNFLHQTMGRGSVYESESFILPPKTTIALEISPDLKTSAGVDIRGRASIEASDGISGAILLDPELRETFIPDLFGNTDGRKSTLEQLSHCLGQRTAII